MIPFVSIVTPTYNRRRFIPSLIKMIQTQTYPRDRMEWVVYDDGQLQYALRGRIRYQWIRKRRISKSP